MKFPTLLFDADDTLFDFKKAAHHSLLRTLEHFKIELRPGLVELYKHHNHETWLAFERKEITAVQLRRIRFERFLDDIKEIRDPLEMSGHYLQQLSESDHLLDGARPLLDGLRERGHRLALITNGLKEVQRPRIAKARMGGYFEAIVVSDEIGVAKPQAGFFEHVFAQLKNPEKGETLIIGDSLTSDIQGGNRFGVATCWFNPSQRPNRTPHQPTFEIKQLTDLPGRV